MGSPQVVSRDEWIAARKAFLDYVFESPAGPLHLLDLFEGRRQLVVYHFMFDPDWDEGCPMCSFLTDNMPNLAHLREARDTSLVLVCRAPLSTITPFKQRMGWPFPWYSSFGSAFNYDCHVTLDAAVAPVALNYLDLTPLGRQEEGPGPHEFVHHDKYGT